MTRLAHLKTWRDQVAAIDTTGGEIEPVKLTANGERKLLLRLSKGGVAVEMALTEAEAREFYGEVSGVFEWVLVGDLD